MKTFLLLVLLVLSLNTGFSQPIPTDSLYLAQTPPGNTPMLFQLPISVGTRPIERLTISSDNKEIYYSEIDGYPPNILRIKCYKYLNDKWQGPFLVFDGYMAPALSVNDSVMYMQMNLDGYAATACTFYSTRNSTGWSTPVRRLSTSLATHYFQETNLKNYYLSTTFPGPSLRDISILSINGTDTIIKNLGAPISTGLNEGDFFIARDESYIIHARSTPPLSGDLYISYKKADGNWTNSKSLGPLINLPNPSWEYGPFVTQDNKYMFFTRGGSTMPTYSTYWVKIDNIIDSLRHTNFVPYLKNQIPNQTDTVGQILNYTIPDSTFVDDDGNSTLTYSATLSSGSALPSWINFNPTTRTFTFTPTAIGSTGIKVTATDTANVSITCTFTLNIVDHTFIHESNGQIIKDYKLFQNFPNPFNPSTVISYSLSNNSNVSVKLYDVLGKEIVTLVDSFQKTGVYDINLDMSKLNLSSGIYYYALSASEQNSGKIFRETKIMSYLK
jgi:hypothetical protein